MSLTFGSGPLAPRRGDLNFSLEDAPKHQLLFDDYPRRMRAFVGERVVLDSTRGKLLYESNIGPVYYCPIEDLSDELLVDSELSTHCPFKGDASYWSVKVGDRVIEDAIWYYPEPTDEAPWLKGYAALTFDKADLWMLEDEPVRGHLRDPYHRVDVYESSRKVTVKANGTVIAESDRPKLLFETSLPPRAYLLRADVIPGILEQSATTSNCPYKGDATYWNVRTADGVVLEDAAWSYETPLPETGMALGHLSFDGEGIEIEVS
jgi:uncharacterized protein (DUF427 family)